MAAEEAMSAPEDRSLVCKVGGGIQIDYLVGILEVSFKEKDSD